MIQIGTLYVGSGALGDRAQFLDGGLTPAPLKSLVTLAKSLSNGARHGFPGRSGDRLGKLMSFRILDIEAHADSSFLYQRLPFFIIARLLHRNPNRKRSELKDFTTPHWPRRPPTPAALALLTSHLSLQIAHLTSR